MQSHRDLIVWQRSIELVTEIYRLVKILPKTETYALSDQMRRSVISIASNIAEGFCRNSTREYIQFLSISRGSCFEPDTQIQACLKIGYLTEEDIKKAFAFLEEIIKMLNTLINKLKSNLGG